MGVKFLSDEWFEQAEAAKASVDNFEVPSELKDAVINVTATGDDGAAIGSSVLRPRRRGLQRGRRFGWRGRRTLALVLDADLLLAAAP